MILFLWGREDSSFAHVHSRGFKVRKPPPPKSEAIGGPLLLSWRVFSEAHLCSPLTGCGAWFREGLSFMSEFPV